MPVRVKSSLLILLVFSLLTACSASHTPEAVVLQFSDIPEQIAPRGEMFSPLDLYSYLRYRDFSAEEMTWDASTGEHIALTLSSGVASATALDPSWIGSETIQVEACEPSGLCVTQTIVYSVLDGSAFRDVRVTYVGNSGFLITVGDKKVLIDAFFAGFPGGYGLPQDVQDRLLNAEPPFDNVDLILATHDHADHFSASMVQAHMQHNPNAVFVSTTQAVSQLADLGERVIAVDPVAGTPVQVEANGIQIMAIYLSHGYPPDAADEIYNNGYVVTLNGTRVFHTGDLAELGDVSRYDLWELDLDLAFIPHFYLQDGSARSILTNEIAADYLIPIHYEYTDPVFNIDRIRSSYPEAIFFLAEMQSWFMPQP